MEQRERSEQRDNSDLIYHLPFPRMISFVFSERAHPDRLYAWALCDMRAEITESERGGRWVGAWW
jgi:hypothetical protein